MRSLVLKADLLSPEYKINFKGKKSTKTVFGVFLTLIAGCTILAATVFFSLEMFLKENPISRSILRLSENSNIFLEEYPIMLGFTINGGEFISNRITEDFAISATIINIDNRVPNYAYLSNLAVEPCKEEFFPNNQEVLELAQIEAYLCIDPFKVYDTENNLLEGKPLIALDFGQNFSKTVAVKIFKKSSLSDEEFKKKYGRIDMILTAPERFVDVEDYNNPIKTKLSTNQIIIDNNIITTSYVKASKESLRTDTGVLLENYEKEEYFTFKTIEFKYNTKGQDDLISELFVSSSSFATYQSREYLKAQTVFAQIGGIAKAITFIAKLLVGAVSEYKFYCENSIILNKLSNNRSINNSDIQLNHVKRPEEEKNRAVTENKLSLWKFLFWGKKAFNENFMPKRTFEKQFDIERINKVLANVIELSANDQVVRPEVISRLE